MKKMRFMTVLAAVVLSLSMVACGAETKPAESKPEAKASESKPAESKAAESKAEAKSEAKEVEVKDIHGTVKVPVNPKVVISLDNRTFDTLHAWGVKLAAAPKDVMPPESPYVKDESVKNVGNHREPNLELIAAAQPELVIIGQRFAKYYEQIKKLVPTAAVVDLSFQLPKEKGKAGPALVKGLEDSTTALGQIFGKEAEAKKLNEEFEKAIEAAKKAYNGKDTVMAVVVSGGKIGFSAPYAGRVWGPMYDIFGWVSALKIDNASSDHKGDDISVEAIAQSNPDWLMVLDRDASTSSAKKKEFVPAMDVIHKSPALQNIKAVKENHIVLAPNDTYTNESIQTYIKLFGDIAKTLGK